MTSRHSVLMSSTLDPPPGFDPKTELVVQWSMWDFILVLRRQALENQPRNILRLDACLATASTIVDQVEAAANEGWLVVLQDTAACMTSALTVLLHKVRRATRRSVGRRIHVDLDLVLDLDLGCGLDLALALALDLDMGWDFGALPPNPR